VDDQNIYKKGSPDKPTKGVQMFKKKIEKARQAKK
jgi:hypothetical protein